MSFQHQRGHMDSMPSHMDSMPSHMDSMPDDATNGHSYHGMMQGGNPYRMMDSTMLQHNMYTGQMMQGKVYDKMQGAREMMQHKMQAARDMMHDKMVMKKAAQTSSAPAAVPYGRGTSFPPTNPALSNAQAAALEAENANISRLTSAVGCAYTGFDHGIQCQYNGMPTYRPSIESFHGNWGANVKGGWPLPDVKTPGGLAQIMLGGGSGDPACAAACSCNNSGDCTCQNGPGQTCGYDSVRQTCVEPFSGGQYASLTACENANARGNFRP